MADADLPGRSAPGLPLPDQVALVLQGGGALGAYQVGVFGALDAARIEIDWVAGISIGAVNAAIIAGNPPDRRLGRLHDFWDAVTRALPALAIFDGSYGREAVHETSAMMVAAFGVPGFFQPRFLAPWFAAPGSPGALSFYDSAPLAATLDELIDWDLLNDGPVRLSVGAVELESGNFRYFDTGKDRIDARHIMASGALPPGLPPIEIEGRLWWDGGLVSNTPLGHVVDNQSGDMLVFQVDLFPAAAERPQTMLDVIAREKEIRYSSRTRQVSNELIRRRQEHQQVARLLDKLPADMADDPDVVELRARTRDSSLSLVQLIYRANAWEGGSRDYEFSQRTMRDHIAAGRAAIDATMTRSGLIARNIYDGSTAAFDLVPR